MARIRTIKPDFFRHEGLQDLATQHGAHVMLVFAGLWGHCDRFGRFECKPRHLKLDILPFLEFDMAETIRVLESAGFIQIYDVGSKRYGFILSFTEHQRFGGKEASEPAKYPEPPVKSAGSNGEATVKQPPPLEWNKGMEYGIGKGVEAREQVRTAPKSRGTRWPADAVVSEDWIAEGEAYRDTANLQAIDLRTEALKFANYWASKSGGGATKIDWKRTWLNWCMTAKGTGHGKPNGGKSQLEVLADIARNGLHPDRSQ